MSSPHMAHLTPQSHYRRSRRRAPSDEPDYDEMEPIRKSRTPNGMDEGQRSSAGNKVDPMNNVWTAPRLVS